MSRKRSPTRLFLALLVLAAAILISQGYLPRISDILIDSRWERPSSCGNLEIYVLNVSAADAILIRTPGNRTILIDAGSAMKSGSAERVSAFLDQQGIWKIDYVIATHFHEDHIGGMGHILSTREIGSVYANGNCAGSATKTTERFLNYSRTESFNTVNADMDLPSDGCLDEARLIIAYDRPEGCFRNENDNSILLRLAYGNTSFLFTGDCEEECEEELIAQDTKLKTQYLKVGHHGSSTSSSNGFLAAVNPLYAVISTDMDRSIKDSYFHPRLSTMEKLYGLQVFRTDLNGDVKAVSDGTGITIYPEAEADECEIFRGYGNSNASSYSLIPKLAVVCGG